MNKALVQGHSFYENELKNLVHDILDRLSEPDPYDSGKDEDYQINSDHHSESEQEFKERR